LRERRLRERKQTVRTRHRASASRNDSQGRGQGQGCLADDRRKGTMPRANPCTSSRSCMLSREQSMHGEESVHAPKCQPSHLPAVSPSAENISMHEPAGVRGSRPRCRENPCTSLQACVDSPVDAALTPVDSLAVDSGRGQLACSAPVQSRRQPL